MPARAAKVEVLVLVGCGTREMTRIQRCRRGCDLEGQSVCALLLRLREGPQKALEVTQRGSGATEVLRKGGKRVFVWGLGGGGIGSLSVSGFASACASASPPPPPRCSSCCEPEKAQERSGSQDAGSHTEKEREVHHLPCPPALRKGDNGNTKKGTHRQPKTESQRGVHKGAAQGAAAGGRKHTRGDRTLQSKRIASRCRGHFLVATAAPW